MSNYPANQQSVKLVNARYQILQILNSSLFGRTYLVKDIRERGNPKRIIKHLQLGNDDAGLEILEQNFQDDAEILARLGQHKQVPKVLNYTKDSKGVYLHIEYIEGQSLSEFLPSSTHCGRRWNETQVIQLLQEVLEILKFIHSEQIIHCNLNPNTIIRRATDGKWCLIDFNAIQPVEKCWNITPSQLNPAGYIPPEQLALQPQPNSDIYALGIIAIQALTGLFPAQIQVGNNLNKTLFIAEKTWDKYGFVSPDLVAILNQMVQPDAQDRYQNASGVLNAIKILPARKPILNLTRTPLIYASPRIAVVPGAIKPKLEVPKIIEPLEKFYSYSDLAIPLFPLLPLPPVEIDPHVPIDIPRLPSGLIMFGIGLFTIAINYLIIEAGINDIIQPNPHRFKLAEKAINEQQILAIANELCQIKHVCFWRGQPMSEREVYLLLQNAYTRAYKGDFSQALQYLNEITPGSPRYAQVQAKIAEYKRKQTIQSIILQKRAKMYSSNQ
jgi:serine/threonine protein kinase